MIKVGIAGYGDTGEKRHHWIDQHPDMEVVTIADINPEVDCDYRDFYKMIDEVGMDALFVCLPNYLAPIAVKEGLFKGLHVFCEKPPGDTLGSVYDVKICSKCHSSQKLKYGFNHRYHESVKVAKELVDVYGKIISMRGVYGKSRLMPFAGNWRSQKGYAGGGILLDQGIHMLDLFRYFGGEFRDVKSIVSNKFYSADVEDNAYAIMQTEEGVVAMIHSSATLWKHGFELDINCEGGSIKLSGILSGTRSYGEEKVTKYPRRNNIKGADKAVTYNFLDDFSWRDEINEFYDCIINDKPVVNGTIDDAIKTMELVFKIYEEAK